MPATTKTYRITGVDSLNAALDAIRADNPGTKVDDITRCIHIGACPAGLIDPFTRECWELFNAIKDGQGWPWDGGFYGQPHVFYQAAKIIGAELAIITKEDERRNGGSTGKI